MSKKREKMVEYLLNVKDEDIDTSDIPIIDERFNKILEFVTPKQVKRPVTLRLEDSMIDWFKSKGGSYTGNMRDVLFAYMLSQESKR